MKVQLGVDAQVLQSHGAVSEPVVAQMAQQGRVYCCSDWSIAVSGVAGPDGGSVEKPVGTVWIAWAGPSGVTTERCLFPGNREAVRHQTTEHALTQLQNLLN